MRQVEPFLLWIGHAGSAPESSSLRRHQIVAVVDLAIDELPRTYGREIMYCRFPITDGGGNALPIVRAAITTVGGLLQARVPTLVYCSMGLSRSPCVAAGGMALATGRPPDECLADVTRGAASDVSPAMWVQVLAAISAIRSLGSIGFGPFTRGPESP